MIDDFCVSVFIPSIGENVQFKQLTNKHYKNILKFIQNKDTYCLGEYFEFLINDLCVQRNLSFNRVDKFLIILTLYIVCINSILDITRICEDTNKEYGSKMELFEILKNMTDANLYSDALIAMDTSTKLKLGYPSNLRFEDTGEMFTECIKYVIVNDKEFNLELMSKDEKDNIFNLLPLHCFGKIKSYIKNAMLTTSDIEYMSAKSPFTNKNSKKYTFNIFDNTLFEFICFIFGSGLKEYYDIMYIAVSKLNFNEEFAQDKLTPAELLLYLKIYEEELHNKHQKASPGEAPTNYNVDPIAPQRVDLGLNFD
jgi:hypothetical protein